MSDKQAIYFILVLGDKKNWVETIFAAGSKLTFCQSTRLTEAGIAR